MAEEYIKPHVNEIEAGDSIRTVLAVSSAILKQARNGHLYWQLELKDSTGSIVARIWSPLAQEWNTIQTGILAEIEGHAEQYNDQKQLTLTSFRPLDEKEYNTIDLSCFMESSRYAPTDMLAALEKICHTVFTFKPWRTFALNVLKDEWIRHQLLTAPAAKEIHHAWVGGLLEHTLGVCRLCLAFADLYPNLDKETLLAAAMFHDIGKLREFSRGIAPDYTDEGRLLGHISLGVNMLIPFLEEAHIPNELKTHFIHLILSHHGLREYGSPVLPQTAESFALHYADNMDAKMIQCRSLFESSSPSDNSSDLEADIDFGAWSPYQRTLERSVYLAPHTPADPQVDKVEVNNLLDYPLEYKASTHRKKSKQKNDTNTSQKDKDSKQCSLL